MPRRVDVEESLARLGGVGTWEFDLDREETRWSVVTRELYGLPPDAPVPDAEAALSCFPGEAGSVLAQAVERLREHGRPYDLELAFRDLAGRDRWVRVTGQALHHDGRIRAIHGTIQDLTRSYRERDRLRRFRRRVELSEEGLIELEADGDVRYANRRAVELLDLRSGQVLGRPLPMLIGDPDHRRAWTMVLEDLEPGTRRVRLPVRTRAGGERWLQVALRRDRVTAGDHDDPALLLVLTDVTDLVNTAAELARREDLLHRVLRATDDGWWETDLRTGQAYCSPRWYELHGLAPVEGPAAVTLWRDLTHPDDLPMADAALAAAAREQAPTLRIRGRAIRADGEVLHLDVHMLLEYDEIGLWRVSGTTRDVTELVLAEQAKEGFVATVGHELRSPLTAITGALDTLERGAVGELPDDAGAFLVIARRNATRLLGLIDDLLDTQRVLDGRFRLEIGEHDPVGLLERALADLEPVAAAAQVTLHLDARSSVGRVRVDPGRFQQVVTNLVANAVRYAPEGSAVDIELTAAAAPGWAQVIVRDRGPGVPPGFLPRLFQRFAQADAEEPGSAGGTGLGLAISRDLIEAMGGQIQCRSEPGCTEFRFTVPVVVRG